MNLLHSVGFRFPHNTFVEGKKNVDRRGNMRGITNRVCVRHSMEKCFHRHITDCLRATERHTKDTTEKSIAYTQSETT